MIEKLIKPKVKDIIKYLQTLPENNDFIIIDPDTEWVMSTVYINSNIKDTICITGSYLDIDDNKRLNDLEMVENND